jgi:hypothetical protein
MFFPQVGHSGAQVWLWLQASADKLPLLLAEARVALQVLVLLAVQDVLVNTLEQVQPLIAAFVEQLRERRLSCSKGGRDAGERAAA